MKNLYTVIKKPLFTEKGSTLKEAENKLLIEVSSDANKIEIKKAIEEIFKVKVEK
jgi:large subunit ribosomal protein L23